MDAACHGTDLFTPRENTLCFWENLPRVRGFNRGLLPTDQQYMASGDLLVAVLLDLAAACVHSVHSLPVNEVLYFVTNKKNATILSFEKDEPLSSMRGPRVVVLNFINFSHSLFMVVITTDVIYFWPQIE